MASNYNLVGQHERYADSDGLQVVETPPGGDLMVVNEQEGYKEASPVPTPTATPATMKTYHDTTALHAESQSEPRRPWWKRKLFIGLAIAFVVLALGLGIGLGVALSSNSSDDEEGSNNDESNQDSKAAKPVCPDGHCPQILSTAMYQDKLHVIARTKNNGIVLRTTDGKSSKWDDWFDLGQAPGGFISQPTAATWNVNGTYPRLDVVAVSTSRRVIYGLYHTEEEGWTDWARAGNNAGSPIQACIKSNVDDDERLDFWMREDESETLSHNFWVEKAPDEISDAGFNGDTSEQGAFSSGGKSWGTLPGIDKEKTSATPAVVCRDSTNAHDLFWYDTGFDTLVHSAYDDDEGAWGDPRTFEGHWVGEPQVVSFEDTPSEWHFIGVQKDGKAYHLSRNEDSSGDGYSEMKNMGSLTKIVSTPSIISIDKGIMDVIAMREDGQLVHRHLEKGRLIGDDWEILDIHAGSAPVLAAIKDKIYILAVSKDGDLQAWTVPKEKKQRWNDSLSKAVSLGGKLSTAFLTDKS